MNDDILGKYVHKKNRSHFLELKSDGNYFLYQGSASVSGRYEVNGAEITMSIDDSTTQARIRESVITDAEGDQWIRTKSTQQGTVPIDDDPLPNMIWLPAILRRDDFPWELIEAAGLFVVLLLILYVALSQRP